MRLNLKYEPRPVNAPRFAADIVGVAQKVSGVAMDYSVDSLKQVDDFIEGMRSEGCTPDQIAETLFVGEMGEMGGKW